MRAIRDIYTRKLNKKNLGILCILEGETGVRAVSAELAARRNLPETVLVNSRVSKLLMFANSLAVKYGNP